MSISGGLPLDEVFIFMCSVSLLSELVVHLLSKTQVADKAIARKVLTSASSLISWQQTACRQLARKAHGSVVEGLSHLQYWHKCEVLQSK